MSTINAIRRGTLQRIVPNVTNLSQVQLMKTILLRNDGNGTVNVTIANHYLVHAKAIQVPKHVMTNIRGPITGWVND